MKLTKIHSNFSTDKGTKHSYIPLYEELFEPIREDNLNLLEIGVLFGGSLKMWEYYFENSNIYGIEDFSQPTGQAYYNDKPVVAEEVMRDLSKNDRIKLFNISCQDTESVHEALSSLEMDIIIDDASHDPEQQKSNMNTFLPKVKEGGIYVCEDVRTNEIAQTLVDLAKTIKPNCDSWYRVWGKKRDDRMVVVRL